MGEIIKIFGEDVEVRVSSKDSNNTCCVCIQTCPPGGGPPPHRHDREDEVFQVLEGDFEFFSNGTWARVACGDTLFSARGSYHAFRNCGDAEGRMLFYTNAGGLDEYFRLIAELKVPADMARLLEISRHFGIYFLSNENDSAKPAETKT